MDVQDGRHDVSKALLPILLHEVRGATQLLVGLRAILEIPGGDAMFESRSGDLADTSRRLDDLGLALAVLSTATGANMLLARREARSAQILWDLAMRASRSQSVGLPRGPIECEGAPPLIAPSALEGWQVAWVGAALVVASFQVEGGFRWAWTEGGVLDGVPVVPGSTIDGETLARAQERVPGSELGATPEGHVRWTLPPAWITNA